MCDLCTKHGHGKRWYLEARNYSNDLLSDARRQSVLLSITKGALSEEGADELSESFQRLERMASLPKPIRALLSWYAHRRSKRDHFGQVVPIEDVEKVLGLVTSIALLPCACRHTLTREEHRYCLGVSVAPDWGNLGKVVEEGFPDGPHLDDFERITPGRALELMQGWEREGLVHTVWTFGTPFIGGICNCDRSDCMAMRATVRCGVRVMYRGELVGQIDWDGCTGCRSCMRVCQFGAIGYSAANRKAFIDARQCYGCGVCRSVCSHEAIGLVERTTVAEAAKLW